MVSPLEKSGGNVSPNLGVHAAPGGTTVSFVSTASFAGSPASPLVSTYIARRGPDWATEAIDPEQFNYNSLLIRGTPASSRDLRYSFGVSRLALAPGAVEAGSNLYLRDNATGARTLLVATHGDQLFNAATGIGGGAFLSASADWSNVLVESSRELLPVPASGPQPAAGLNKNNLYELRGGQAHLVNVLPDGTVDPEGAHIGGGAPYQHLMSEDGSRTFFQIGSNNGTGALYLREDGTTTVPISMSENGAEAGQMKPAEFGVATPDGSVVYFNSFYELIEGAGKGALYRYDVPARKLSAVIQNPPAGGPDVGGVFGAGGDGSYVYFGASESLAEGAPVATGSNTNFYVWHDGAIQWIGQTDSSDLEANFPRQWSISPNGKFFGFASTSPMTAEDVSSPACPKVGTVNNAPEHCMDVYAYAYETNRLTCASCKGETNSAGEWKWLPGRGFSELGGQAVHEQGTGDERPHAVLDDGTVFFDTPNGLSPRDVNAVGDVYAWREGSAELVSTGKGEQPSNFGDATPDGSSIYFLTKQQLVPQDTDESTDLYDDRELGGLASQWPPGSEPPCEGEGCRGASPGAPAGLRDAAAGAAPAKGAARSCTAVRKRAKKAGHQARKLAKRARRSAKRSHASAHTRRLRHRAAVARKRAHRIHQKAVTCGRKSR
jgi:hypothetical protein